MSKQQREVNRAARAAAIRKQQRTKERNQRILITLAVVVVLSAVVAAGVIFSGGEKKSPDGGDPAAARADSPAMVLGPEDAPHKVVIYEDFLCPYCREFESATQSFVREYAKKGKARVEYRPFYLLQDPYSLQALSVWGTVLEKGTPGQALKLHDLLYENQPYEAAPNKPDIDDLIGLAKKAGVEDDAVLDAMKKENRDFVESAGSAARADDVKGTPTIMVDGKELQGDSITAMADNLERILSKD